MIKTDVAVIGGGIIGSSIAYYLSKNGAEVTVIEKGKLLGGASGSNQGGIPVSLFDPPLLDLVLASRDLYSGLSDELGCGLGFDETGLLLLVLKEDQIPILERFHKRLERRDLPVTRLPVDEIKGEEDLSQDIVAALKTELDASVDPFKVGFGFISNARDNGVEFLKDTEVVDMCLDGGFIAEVSTSGPKVKADYVVNAAGPWSTLVGDMVGVDIPVKPRRGQVLVTEPTPRLKYRYLMDFDYLATALGADSDDREKSERMKLGVASSLIQEPSTNWTIGASRDFVGYNKRTTPKTLAHLARRSTEFLPALEGTNVIRSYAGLRPYCSVDGEPILGGVDEIDNFLVATGHAGEGITLAPITGKLVAEEILNRRVPDLFKGFRHSRFSTS